MRARKKGDMYLGKVSNYINQNMAKFKQIYIRYVASIFCVFIIAVVSIIANQKKGFDIESIVTVCSIWLAGNFLVESLWKKTAEEAQKNKQKWLIGYGVTFVIAIVFENLSEILKAQKADIPNLIFESILYFYIACTVLLAIYVLLRQQKLDLPHCIGRIIFALLRAVGVYLVLNIAVILILEIIDALLVDIDTFRVELNIQLLLSALAYFPTCLLAVSDTSEDNAAFTKKFVSYVLLPCVWIAMFVIYLSNLNVVYADELRHDKRGCAHDRRHDLTACGRNCFDGGRPFVGISGFFHGWDGKYTGGDDVADGASGDHAKQGRSDDGYLA